MNKLERKLIYLVFIYIILVSIYFIVKINLGPEYDQELFDEIYSQYEEMKEESETQKTDSKTVAKKKNGTYMSVNVQGQEYKVIGTINIEKININYPIIADTTDENLKIAPTKLCGPLINTIGNLCIIGHNYVNGKLFSNINKLQQNDIVTLIDNNDNSMDYKVYDKYIVSDSDLNCTSQDTNGLTELTLITCTNKENKRLVIKCRS